MSRFLRSLAPFLALSACGGPAAAQPVASRVQPDGIDGRLLERRIDIRIDADGRMVRRERRVIEFLTDFSQEVWGDPLLLWDADRQVVRLETARTTTPDGRTVDTPPVAINELTLPELARAPAFATLREQVVSFVGLEPGARAEIAYVVEDTAPPAAGYAAGEVALQGPLPVGTFELRVSVPRETALTHDCVECGLEPAVTEADGRVEYVWTARDLPPVDLFEISDHLGGPDDGLDGPRIVLSTAATWEQAVRPWFEAAARADPDEAELRAKVEELTGGRAGNAEALAALQAFVAEGIAGVPWPRTVNSRPLALPSVVLERSYGTPAEKACLLARLLGLAGIEAGPVLRAGSAEPADGVPWVEPYREAWVVARTRGNPDAWLPVDRVAIVSGLERLPLRSLLTLGGSPQPWRPPAPPSSSANRAFAAVELSLADDGAAAAQVRLSLEGAHQSYAATVDDGKDPAKTVAKAAAALLPEGEASEVVLSAFEPARIAGSAEVAGTLPEIGDGWRSLPLEWPGRDLFPAGMHRSERDLPVPLEAAFERRAAYTIALPDGWEPALLPRAARVENAVGTFAQEVTVDGSTVTVERSLVVDRDRIEPAEWPALRALYQAFVTAGRDALVIRPAP